MSHPIRVIAIVGTLYIGLAAGQPQQDIGARARRKAHSLGKCIVARAKANA